MAELATFLQEGAPPSSTHSRTHPFPPAWLEGYWFEGDMELPTERPDYNFASALFLANGDLRVGQETEALDLVSVEDHWGVLSHAAVLTYFHSTGIASGEVWFFLYFSEDGRRKVYEVAPPIGELSPHQIEVHFGEGITKNLSGNICLQSNGLTATIRFDWPTVLLRVRRRE